MEQAGGFPKYLLPNLLALWLDVFWFGIVGTEYSLQFFCSLPQSFHYPGLQLITKLKNSF